MNGGRGCRCPSSWSANCVRSPSVSHSHWLQHTLTVQVTLILKTVLLRTVQRCGLAQTLLTVRMGHLCHSLTRIQIKEKYARSAATHVFILRRGSTLSPSMRDTILEPVPKSQSFACFKMIDLYCPVLTHSNHFFLLR